jgi:hypothetical protein
MKFTSRLKCKTLLQLRFVWRKWIWNLRLHLLVCKQDLLREFSTGGTRQPKRLNGSFLLLGVPMNSLGEKEVVLRSKLSICIPQTCIQKPPWPNLMLDVDGSHQFLYRLVPKVENARQATNIGKLDIVWRTTMGDRGRLQTSQLQRQVIFMTLNP